ncbi:MAG: diadenylate cyclase, partial [Akkermansia sp.]
RAAVGLSDETDSVVVVVSEETGAISIAVAGKLERNLDIDQLKARLDELLNLTGNDEIKESH